MARHSLRADLLMLLTALIWGTTFVAQKMGMDAIGPFLYTGLRFALGAVLLIPVLYWFSLRRRAQNAVSPVNRSAILGGIALGVVLTIGINLQQVGLMFTTVTNSGFITGLYVIMVPLLGLLIGQRTGAGTWLGASLAVVGMYLLSVGENFSVASGDWLQLAGAVIWGVHVLLAGRMASRHDPILIAYVQFITCAVISSLLALAFEPWVLEKIIQALPAIVYGGALAVAVGFTLQLVAQRDAPPAHAAIILSLEAVFAAMAGWVMMDETLTLRGFIGCGLMFAGMLVAQLLPMLFKRPKALAESA
ncbi:Threonine/homoserine efflux transporter RhtA [Atopomonas hussainii]|uniref:Threonine/homoserine efflux transporter RhtA n=1 Tax=Atopomonas hussainii TaxID=1429083 RepID=A0A1H7GGP7_9GAMM|nr:DMT family transporter [Atopomonas hussainii]SEK37288.1 Threonine/homoserine efflux transporter RhtA [Atopomonas hussainii]